MLATPVIGAIFAIYFSERFFFQGRFKEEILPSGLIFGFELTSNVSLLGFALYTPSRRRSFRSEASQCIHYCVGALQDR